MNEMDDLKQQRSLISEQIEKIHDGSKVDNLIMSLGMISSLLLVVSIINKSDFFDLSLLFIAGFAYYKEKKNDRLLRIYQADLEEIDKKINKRD